MSEKPKASISAEWLQDEGATIHLQGDPEEIAALYLTITKGLIKSLSRDGYGKMTLRFIGIASQQLFVDASASKNDKKEDTTS